MQMLLVLGPFSESYPKQMNQNPGEENLLDVLPVPTAQVRTLLYRELQYTRKLFGFCS